MGEAGQSIVGPEPLRPEYFDSMIQLLDRVFRSGGGRSMALDHPFFLRPENFSNLFICRVGDKVVTQVGLVPLVASLFGHCVHVGMIGAVATDPDFRGQGVATRTLQVVYDHWRQQGGQLMMISGGRGLYVRSGARSVGSFGYYVLDLPDKPLEGLGIERCQPDHAAILGALYRRRPLRFIRPIEAWRLHIQNDVCTNTQAHYWLVRRGDVPTGYFALPVVPEEDGLANVREWGGEWADVVAALPAAASPVGVRRVRWRLYPHETEARRYLEEAGARFEGNLPGVGTVKVIDFEALMRALTGYVTEVLGEKLAERIEFRESGGESFQICLDDEDLSIHSYGTLVEILFGGGAAALPQELQPGPLSEALGALLPLPLPQYSMTYA